MPTSVITCKCGQEFKSRSAITSRSATEQYYDHALNECTVLSKTSKARLRAAIKKEQGGNA